MYTLMGQVYNMEGHGCGSVVKHLLRMYVGTGRGQTKGNERVKCLAQIMIMTPWAEGRDKCSLLQLRYKKDCPTLTPRALPMASPTARLS